MDSSFTVNSGTGLSTSGSIGISGSTVSSSSNEWGWTWIIVALAALVALGFYWYAPHILAAVGLQGSSSYAMEDDQQQQQQTEETEQAEPTKPEPSLPVPQIADPQPRGQTAERIEEVVRNFYPHQGGDRGASYESDTANSEIQTGNKNGWCYIGEDRGYRACAAVGMRDQCMSGDIFPTHDVCINPNLRA